MCRVDGMWVSCIMVGAVLLHLCVLHALRRGAEALRGPSRMHGRLHQLHQALQLDELGVGYQLQRSDPSLSGPSVGSPPQSQDTLPHLPVRRKHMPQLGDRLAPMTGGPERWHQQSRERELAVPLQSDKLPGRWQSSGAPLPHELTTRGGCCCHGSPERSGCMGSAGAQQYMV